MNTEGGNDSFEPFVQREEPGGLGPPGRNRFINNYGGPYSSIMELNRTAVEKFIQLSRLGGKVILSSLPHSSQRVYPEANPDGSVASKRSLTIGQRDIERENNPYYRVLATGDGWIMQINGEAILDEVQTDEAKKRENKFVKVFNSVMHSACIDCLTGEKLSSTKDIFFGEKLFGTLIQPVIVASASVMWHHDSLEEFILDFVGRMVTTIPPMYALGELAISSLPHHMETNPRPMGPEIFLPPLRIEDVLIGRGYMYFNGRTLVRISSRQN